MEQSPVAEIFQAERIICNRSKKMCIRDTRNGFLHEMPPVLDRAAWLVVPAAIRLSPLSAMGFRGGTVNIACYGRESNLKMCIRDSLHIAGIGQLAHEGRHRGWILPDGFSQSSHGPVSYTHLDVYKRQALLEALSRLLAEYSTAEMKEINVGTVLTEVIEVLRGQNMMMTSSVTMLARGFVTIEGVMAQVAPDISVIEIVSKHVIAQQADPKFLATQLIDLATTSAASAEALAKLPSQLSNTLETVSYIHLGSRPAGRFSRTWGRAPAVLPRPARG